MKLAFITRYWPSPCGIAEYSRYLVNELAKLDRVERVYVYGNKAAEHVSCGKLRVIPAFNEEEEGYHRELAKYLKDRYPLIHVQFEYGVFHADECPLRMMELLRGRAGKLIVTMHSVSHVKRGGVWVRTQRYIGELADAVVVHHVIQAFELFVQGVNPRKVHVIPHGTRIFKTIPREKALKVLGLGGEAIILAMGFIRRDKGLNDLMEAFKLVKRLLGGATLVIAGKEQFLTSYDVDYAKNVLKRAKEMEGVVLLNEYLREGKIRLLLSAADVVVFPYKLFKPGEEYYSISGALHLAMGAKKVIVASRVPKMAEYCELVPELTYPPGDVEGLADKLILALTDKEVREEAVRRVWRYGEETSWRRVALKHLSLYEELAS